MRPTHKVTDGPLAGTECWVHAIGPRSVSIRFTRPGWPFPIFGAVEPKHLKKNAPAEQDQALL